MAAAVQGHENCAVLVRRNRPRKKPVRCERVRTDCVEKRKKEGKTKD